MAQILFRLIDNFHSNPEKDRQGCYKKGYPVSIKPDGWYEGNPNWHQSAYADKTKWIVVEVPDATGEELKSYIREWRDDFDYEIIATRPAKGEYDVRIYEKNASPSGANAITMEKVGTFLTKWGCTGISASSNSVTFTFSLWNAVRSEGFWDVPQISLKGAFALNSYSNGVGNITFTVIPDAFPGMTQEQLTRVISGRIQMRGGENLVVNYPAFTFDIERSDILTRFREDVKLNGKRTYRRRRFVLPSSLCDTIAAGGGFTSMTKAALAAAIRDGITEQWRRKSQKSSTPIWDRATTTIAS